MTWALWVAYNIGLMTEQSMTGQAIPFYANYGEFKKSLVPDKDETQEEALGMVDNFL